MRHLGILGTIDDPAFIVNYSGQLVESNRAFSNILDHATPLQPISQAWPEISELLESTRISINSGSQPRIDVNATTSDHRKLVFDVRVFKIQDDSNADELLAFIARDVTAERLSATNMELKATIDSLTNTYNRGQLEVLVTQAIRSAQRRKTPGTFVFIDIDKFKEINDSLGHSEGDRILQETAELLRKNLRTSDVIGRLGGDEFGLILIDANKSAAAIKIQQIANELKRTVVPSGSATGIDVSIGLAEFPTDAHQVASVLAHADSAMYRAKLHPGRHIEP
ncbi:MAG: diguanylate cyclase [Chloroflexi bacterium]|jgi:diguanylate cyclase (GGDEF)-like protein|nr:diguanylate cyclase [Chloroflexota bacterium]